MDDTTHCTFVIQGSTEIIFAPLTYVILYNSVIAEIGFNLFAFKKGKRTYKTYRRDVLNRVCSYTQ